LKGLVNQEMQMRLRPSRRRLAVCALGFHAIRR
jgi:hypothetical protein